MSSTRVTVYGVFSDQSDFSGTKHDYRDEYEVTTNTKRMDFEGVAASTGGVTIDLSTFTTVDNLYVKNQDSSIAVTVTGQSNSVAFSLYLAAGRSFNIPNVTPGADITLTSASGSPLVDVFCWGT